MIKENIEREYESLMNSQERMNLPHLIPLTHLLRGFKERRQIIYPLNSKLSTQNLSLG